jgi:hypothetical protein
MTKHPYANKLAYTLTTWRECVIWCACEDGGWRECNARVYGALAMHRALEPQEHLWQVTHIPTGKKVEDDPEPYFSAQDYIERLTSLGDWNTRSVGKLKRLREAM